jgi:hypothetical protein
MESSASFRRTLEGGQSAQIDTGNVANRDKHHHSGAAAMASDHCPGRTQIDLRLGDVELGVAARAHAFRSVISMPKTSKSIPAIALPSSVAIARLLSASIGALLTRLARSALF